MICSNLIKISVLGSVSIWVGCSSVAPPLQKDIMVPEIDVIQVKENSDEAIKLAQETKLEVDALSAKVTEIDNKIFLLTEQLSKLSVNKFEQMENQLLLLTEEIKALQEREYIANAPSIKLPAGRVDKYVEDNVSMEIATFKPAAGSGETSEPVRVQYKKGLLAFNKKNMKEAIVAFKKAYGEEPEGPLADNALYWMGECYFLMGDYAQAIEYFQKVFSFVETEKADDTQLKLGFCYLKLGKKSQALVEFDKLIQQYPESEYIQRTKDQIAKIR